MLAPPKSVCAAGVRSIRGAARRRARREAGLTRVARAAALLVAMSLSAAPVLAADPPRGPAATGRAPDPHARLARLRAVAAGRFPGKVVIYPNIAPLPLTPLSDLKAVLPDVYTKLEDGRIWTVEAERELLSGALPGT